MIPSVVYQFEVYLSKGQSGGEKGDKVTHVERIVLLQSDNCKHKGLFVNRMRTFVNRAMP